MNLRKRKRRDAVVRWLDRVTEVMEIIVAVIVLVGFIISVIPLLRDMPGLLDNSNEYSFHVFLEHAFNLVIGIEFIRMLVRHTPGSALGVLMFAIARHMVLDNEGGIELLLCVAAIAGIFVIRKFLYVPSFNLDEEDLSRMDERDSSQVVVGEKENSAEGGKENGLYNNFSRKESNV